MNASNKYAFTALMLSTIYNRPEIVDELLKYGAHMKFVNKWGETALMLAAEHGQFKNSLKRPL